LAVAGAAAHSDLLIIPGGAMNPGEFIAYTAVREVGEESGINIEVASLIGLDTNPTTSTRARLRTASAAAASTASRGDLLAQREPDRTRRARAAGCRAEIWGSPAVSGGRSVYR